MGLYPVVYTLPVESYNIPSILAFPFTYKALLVLAEYPPIPMILPAGTDARTLTDVCECVLRFAPIKLSAQQLASVHAENENIDVDSVANCVAFYKHYIKNYK